MLHNYLFEDIWDDYVTFRDCLKIAQRAIKREARWVQRTELSTMTSADALQRIVSRFDDLEDRTVLALWTRFERYVIEYLQQVGQSLSKTEPASVIEQLREQLAEAIERRRFNELLKLFDAIVDPQSLGGARNVKKYRDWIVHRNPRKGEPEKVDAKTARKAFSDIITAIRAADLQAQ